MASVSRQQETTQEVSTRRHLDPLWGFGGDLFRMSPFALLSMMTEQMDRAFSGLTGGRGATGEIISWTPSVEVREKDNNLIVCADLPGVDHRDLKVEVVE